MNMKRSTRRPPSGGHRRLTQVAAAGLAAFALTGGLLGFGGHQARAQTASPTTTGYVVDQIGKVAVVNTASGTVTDWISVPNADFIALDPTGAHAYVTSAGALGAGTVSVINTSTKVVTATISVGSYPSGIAVNSSDTNVYVSNRDDDTVSVIDTSSNQVIATIPNVGDNPRQIAFNPGAPYAYVATDTGVVIINTTTRTVVTTIPSTGGQDVAVNLFGSYAYVTGPSNFVSVIDTSTNTVTASIPVSGAWALALTPYADKLYVTELTTPGSIAVIDTATNTVTKVIQNADLLESALYIAMSADGSFAYAADTSAGDVAVIDTTTDTVSGTVTDAGFAGPYDVVMNGHPQLSAPGTPTDLKGKVKGASVTLTWMDHGQGITDHQVQAFVYTKARKSGGPTYEPVTQDPLLTGSAAASYLYDGLTAGKTYVFKVAAENIVGPSEFSNYSNTVTIKP